MGTKEEAKLPECVEKGEMSDECLKAKAAAEAAKAAEEVKEKKMGGSGHK